MKVPVKPLPDRVAETITRYNMLPSRGRVGVAVSGGGDSVALTRLMKAIHPEATVAMLHFNHRLRGAASDEDARFVRELARELKLDHSEASWDEAPVSNVEAEARRARLDFFQKARQELKLDRVATAHTLDDQAETVLLRLLRGAGPGGLAGVLPVTDEGLIRPVIEVRREELRDWLRAGGHTWREDATNIDPLHADRNRLRHELLPVLREQWNPAIEVALAQTAEIAGAEEEYWAQIVAPLVPSGPEFAAEEIAGLPAALQRRVVRALIERERGGLRRIGFHHIEAVRQLAAGEDGSGAVPLPGNWAVKRSFDRMRIGPAAAQEGVPRVHLIKQARPDVYNTKSSYLDCQKLSGTPILRVWQPGDSYQPRGHSRARKLKELFQIARIPSWERENWPILEGDGQVLWSRRFGPAAAYAAGESSKAVLEIIDEGGGG
jgi:tRNA(Ile)-lysidine synthase